MRATDPDINTIEKTLAKQKQIQHLSNIHFPCVHELEDSGEVVEGNIFEDDDGMFGGILLEKILEVWTARAENHLVSLGVLTLRGCNQRTCYQKKATKDEWILAYGHVTERLFISQMFEGGHHVGLEVIPPQTKLLIISRHV